MGRNWYFFKRPLHLVYPLSLNINYNNKNGKNHPYVGMSLITTNIFCFLKHVFSVISVFARPPSPFVSHCWYLPDPHSPLCQIITEFPITTPLQKKVDMGRRARGLGDPLGETLCKILGVQNTQRACTMGN